MSIKTFVMIPRKSGIREQEFHDHWRYPHATWGCGMSTLEGYVQSHRIDWPELDRGAAPYDGIAEAWFADETSAGAFREEPVLERYLKPDEPLFIDMDRLNYVVTIEDVIDEPNPDAADPADPASIWSPWRAPTSVKLFQIMLPGVQGDLVREGDRELGRRIGALRHVCCRPSQSVHGDAPPFGGVRELQWPTFSEFQRGIADAPEAFEAIVNGPHVSINLLAQAELFLDPTAKRAL